MASKTFLDMQGIFLLMQRNASFKMYQIITNFFGSCDMCLLWSLYPVFDKYCIYRKVVLKEQHEKPESREGGVSHEIVYLLLGGAKTAQFCQKQSALCKVG